VLRKGGKIVTIPLAPRTGRAIDLAIGERLDGPIFLRPDGKRMDRHCASRIVRRVARRASVDKPIGPHTLRHAFITAALDAGVPLHDVQEAASHADPRTTMRYDRARVSLIGTRPTSSPLTSPAPHARAKRRRTAWARSHRPAIGVTRTEASIGAVRPRWWLTRL
jgi:integrase